MSTRRLSLLLVAALLAIVVAPAVAQAETWTKASLVDGMCVSKVKDKADSHTRECALKCASGGLGILTADGHYLKLDDQGVEQAIAALKASDRQDHLRVDVSGKLEGDTIQVEKLALVD